MRVGILFAIPEEFKAFDRLLATKLQQAPRKHDRHWPKELRKGGNQLVLYVSGSGVRNAARAGRHVCEARVNRVLAAGVAGALSKNLEMGDIVFASRVWREDGGSFTLAHSETALPMPSSARIGDLITTPRVVGTRREKDGLLRRWQSQGNASEAIIADMETAAIAQVAKDNNILFTAIRAISDTAEEDLPLDFNQFLDETGDINRRKVALHAATHPWLIPSLSRLCKSTRFASERLAQALLEWIDALPRIDD